MTGCCGSVVTARLVAAGTFVGAVIVIVLVATLVLRVIWFVPFGTGGKSLFVNKGQRNSKAPVRTRMMMVLRSIAENYKGVCSPRRKEGDSVAVKQSPSLRRGLRGGTGSAPNFPNG